MYCVRDLKGGIFEKQKSCFGGLLAAQSMWTKNTHLTSVNVYLPPLDMSESSSLPFGYRECPPITAQP